MSSHLDAKKVIQRSQAAIGHSIGAYTLMDSKGQPFALATLRGRPLVVSLVYSACSSVCPVATQHLIDAVEQANKNIGSDRYNVLTIGFDARRDTPSRMAQFASVQGIRAPNWIVASADGGTITALLQDLGFSYVSVAGGFDHITQTTIVDRGGRIYRQVYGDEFPVPVFMEPLKDVIFGNERLFTISGILDHIKYICTTFDPGAGRYRIDYGLVFGSVIGAVSLLLFGGLVAREWVRTTRRA